MDVIKRKEAVKQGLKQYFTGKPCKRGHISERFVSDRSCNGCKQLWIKNNNDKHIKSKKNREVNNREKRCQISAKHAKRYPEKRAAFTAKRRAIELQRTPSWSDKSKVDFVWWISKMATEYSDVRFSVDHVIPLQGELVSGLHVHENLEIMTLSDNSAKNNKYTP